jgi:hypothetical protein
MLAGSKRSRRWPARPDRVGARALADLARRDLIPEVRVPSLESREPRAAAQPRPSDPAADFHDQPQLRVTDTVRAAAQPYRAPQARRDRRTRRARPPTELAPIGRSAAQASSMTSTPSSSRSNASCAHTPAGAASAPNVVGDRWAGGVVVRGPDSAARPFRARSWQTVFWTGRYGRVGRRGRSQSCSHGRIGARRTVSARRSR